MWIANIGSGQQDGIDLKWQIRKGFNLLPNYGVFSRIFNRVPILASYYSTKFPITNSNIPISPAQNITTETVFTDLNKTNPLSNPIKTTPHMTDLI